MDEYGAKTKAAVISWGGSSFTHFCHQNKFINSTIKLY
jgi:hypothetical protein